MNSKRLLVVDVSPLWELQFTGISNVVYELSRRLIRGDDRFDIRFSVFHRLVDKAVIERCLEQRSGAALRELFLDIESLKLAADFARNRGGESAGLYLHVKPDKRAFDFEAQLYYDFSFLSVPECHHEDTIAHHVRDLDNQVMSNDLIFTISESTAKDLNFYFDYPVERTQVALLGYHVDDETAWRFAAKFGGERIEPYFICLGTVEPRKNIRLVLAWLARNHWFLQEHRFLFVGRDAWGETFDELIEEVGLGAAVATGRIVHVGYVTEAQKTALLVGARGLVFASLFEGFGLPVLEAMALGVPLAASCTTSIPEVLGPYGIYFDPYSLSSFDEAMLTLLKEQRNGEGEARCRLLSLRAQSFTYDNCYEVIMSRLSQGIEAGERGPRHSADDQPAKGRRKRKSRDKSEMKSA